MGGADDSTANHFVSFCTIPSSSCTASALGSWLWVVGKAGHGVTSSGSSELKRGIHCKLCISSELHTGPFCSCVYSWRFDLSGVGCVLGLPVRRMAGQAGRGICCDSNLSTYRQFPKRMQSLDTRRVLQLLVLPPERPRAASLSLPCASLDFPGQTRLFRLEPTST